MLCAQVTTHIRFTESFAMYCRLLCPGVKTVTCFASFCHACFGRVRSQVELRVLPLFCFSFPLFVLIFSAWEGQET